jgi:hypothetical protein
MKYQAFWLSLVVAMGLSACGGESDVEYVTRIKAQQAPKCKTEIDKSLSKLNIKNTDTISQEVCSCTMDRLFAKTPIRDLRSMEERGDVEAIERAMRPHGEECVMEVIEKNRDSLGLPKG